MINLLWIDYERRICENDYVYWSLKKPELSMIWSYKKINIIDKNPYCAGIRWHSRDLEWSQGKEVVVTC